MRTLKIPYSCPAINEAIKRVWAITDPNNKESIVDQQKRLDNLLEEIRQINIKLRNGEGHIKETYEDLEEMFQQCAKENNILRQENERLRSQND